MLHFRLSTKCLFLFLLLCIFSWTGCGGGDPNLGQVPAKVIIKVDGATIMNATIVFVDDSGNTCNGFTDKAGVAVLRSSISKDNKMIEVKGVLPGDYKVAVLRSDAKQIPDPADPTKTIIESVNHVVPVKYNSYLRSGLTATVKKGDPNEFTFELTQ